MIARAYLRASTSQQDANRAREQVKAFAAEHGLTIAHFYLENESGATLAQPKLFELLEDAAPGDVLFVEQVDRLSRLAEPDWKRLRAELAKREVRVVAIDLPTSHRLAAPADEFTGRVLGAINDLLLDILAATARKDYLDRHRRAAEGRAKAKAAGDLKGVPKIAAGTNESRTICGRARAGAISPSASAAAAPRSRKSRLVCVENWPPKP